MVVSTAPRHPADLLLNHEDRALVALGRALRARRYRFITITPASHHRINGRAMVEPASLEDIFGWSRPFEETDLPEDILIALREADGLDASGPRLRSAVRFSTLGDQLFAHSAFPTEQNDAVFFGPDTYRFARMVQQSLAVRKLPPGARIIDIGAGSGAGGLHVAALAADRSPQVILTDINDRALRFAQANAELNGVPNMQTIKSDLFASVDGLFDLIIANPPYLVDPLARLYRHGGGDLGSAIGLSIVEQGIDRLAPGGRLLLYTGSPIVDGHDALCEALRDSLTQRAVRFAYEEIDPDVFGEELEHPPYDRVDRIAVVAVTIEAA